MEAEHSKNAVVFDAAAMELSTGISLVEASAGTGKTYAISMLVLRFIVEKNITIDQILIVTFTKAATEELRGRIRARLVQGRQILVGVVRDSDATLEEWAKRVIGGGKKEEACARLEKALLDIDQIGIYTIHSFCQRMLSEQALEAGQFFEVELQGDVDQIRLEVVEDYWRASMYSQTEMICSLFLSHFKTPQELYDTIRVSSSRGKVIPQTDDSTILIPRLEKYVQQMGKWWSAKSAQLKRLFEENIAENYFKVKFSTNFSFWWASIDAFLSGESQEYPESLEVLLEENLFEHLNGRRLRGDKKKEFLEGWVLPGQELRELVLCAKELVLAYRLELFEIFSTTLDEKLSAKGVLCYDDLISRLAQKVGDAQYPQLKNIIRGRYRVALIDEFQDTDDQQWQIFFEIFATPAHWMYLIGDPKQAIYKFRGADIFTYFTARKEAAHHLTLESNYRSNEHLVEEVNRLFGKSSDPFKLDKKLPYHKVKPARKEDELYLTQAAKSVSPNVYVTLGQREDGKRWTSGVAEEIFLSFMLEEICRLVAQDSVIEIHANGEARPLRTGDIGILVRTHSQAQRCRKALADHGIPVVLTNKHSVFESRECGELLLILKAIAEPQNPHLLKAAMSCPWFGFTGDEIEEMWHREADIERWAYTFQQYHQTWKDNSFLQMMMAIIKDDGLITEIAKLPVADRAISNIYHLLELVEDAATESSLSPLQTLQWLRERRLGEGEEAAELRLESDEQAIKIITMHGAKGLEYPVVFCPFLWYRSARQKYENNVVSCHDSDNHMIVDFGSAKFETNRLTAVEEELSEELRLAYVALTRASLKCYTMWGDIQGVGAAVSDCFESSLGHLLFEGEKVAYQQQLDVFTQKKIVGQVEHIVIDSSASELLEYRANLDTECLDAAAPGDRSLHTDYQLSSYSALVSGSVFYHTGSLEEEGEAGGKRIAVSGLPAGAHFGQLIHDSLEDFSFDTYLQESKEVRSYLEKKCKRYGVDAEITDLLGLLKNVVRTPLGEKEQRFSLAQLNEKYCLKEMEFYFKLGRMKTTEINSILSGEEGVTHLSPRVMQGYLTGFVDLIFEYNGKFYIIDYKTNYLGEMLNDYCGKKLLCGMESHNYGLQHWIYSMVLHRFLMNSKKGYDFDEHFGGVRYLFVRGMSPDVAGSGVYSFRPSREKLEALLAVMEHEHGG